MFLGGSTGKSDVALPSNNPIARYYTNFKFIGTSQAWKLFSALHRLSRTEHTVFLFEKKHSVKVPGKLVRGGRKSLLELMRWDVRMLQAHSHPRVLTVRQELEENNETLAFATERLLGTLRSVYDEAGHPNALEMKLGLLHITEALSYLHNTYGSVHGNLCPDTVFVDAEHGWKLGGFPFALRSAAEEPPALCWAPGAHPNVQPCLDFLAPERLAKERLLPTADVFSLALLTLFLALPAGPLLHTEGHLSAYHSQLARAEETIESLRVDFASGLKEALIKMLRRDPKKRPMAQLFMLVGCLYCLCATNSESCFLQIKYFDDPTVTCLRQLYDLSRLDPVSKTQFLSNTLLQALPKMSQVRFIPHVVLRALEWLDYTGL